MIREKKRNNVKSYFRDFQQSQDSPLFERFHLTIPFPITFADSLSSMKTMALESDAA
jgi:hypothetical protein